MQVQPYVFFDGRCEEAIEFYQKSIGAQLESLIRFKDNPDLQTPGMVPPGGENKVMHASLRIGDSTILASDGDCQGKATFDGFSLTLIADTAADAQRLFTALSDGGHVQMPLTKTFFSPSFGMLADRFGVSWMVYVVP